MSRISKPSRRGFTLLELLVVISIIVLASALLVPAFGRIIGSTRYTGAINTVTATLGNARAQAMRTGVETGVAFLFDVERERYTMQIVEALQFSGTLTERPTDDPRHAYADAFRPSPGTVPIELAPGTGVYGLSFAVAPSTGDESQIDAITRNWYAGEILNEGSATQESPWLFPRNDPRMYVKIPTGQSAWDLIGPSGTGNRPVRKAIRQANSFIVRFRADGAISEFSQREDNVLNNAYLEFPEEPRDLDVEGSEAFDRRDLFDPDAKVPGGVTRRSPNPEVFLRSASQLAVVDLRRLGEVVGIEKPWLVRPERSGDNETRAPFGAGDARNDVYIDDEAAKKVWRYIDADAEIISFNRYTGNAVRKAAP